MQLHGFFKRAWKCSYATKKTLLMMKTVAFLLLAVSMHVSAKSYSQPISLSLSNAKLATIINAIEKQTEHRFVYTREQLSSAQLISITVKNATLETVLTICFKYQPLSYVIDDRFIIIRQKQRTAPEPKSEIALPDIRGKIINEQGEPLAGVTIAVKGTNNGTTSDANGEFILKNVPPDAVLQISSIGYSAEEIKVQGRVMITVLLKILVSNLDETVVIAYGTTTKRLNTGSVGRVTAEEISRQPVSNPLATLQGRVPGMVVTQSNGVPDSSFKIQIRGKSSLAQGTDPLIIIDGIPFASNNTNINQLSSAASSFGGNGISPFYSVNPADIESIEILKDADATAIYGSRGANGVILITTKKGKAGATQISVNSYIGNNRPTKLPTFLRTTDYLQMRKEAFLNDGIVPNIFSAPDLLLWDSSRYTNFSELLLNKFTSSYSLNTSVSGGMKNTRFQAGVGYFNEGILFKSQQPSERVTLHTNILQRGFDEKFSIELSAFYSTSTNNSTGADLSTFLISPPNIPALYDSTGKLNWQHNGVNFDNPLSYLDSKYKAITENLMGNMVLSYVLLSKVLLKANLGYNSIWFDENNIIPKKAQNPAFAPSGVSSFGNRKFTSLIIEPQVEFTDSIGKGRLSVLAGATMQEQKEKGVRITATGYTNDALLQTLNGAASITVNNQFSLYRYAAFFGRINYQLNSRYILNLTGRRDGSTKFGPGRQWGSFGAIGAAWIFSSEGFASKCKNWLSFGKVRLSYGSSGNDQIANYQYMDGWGVQSNPYQSVPGIAPARLFNPKYSWELSRKMEAGLELGFFNNKILSEISFYRHRSGNQLVQYALPAQTGFTSIIANLPALIQNTGIELSIQAKIIDRTNLKWSLNGVVTIPHNKLLSFPDLETSSYATSYVIGEPLTLLYNFHFTGIDSTTGVYQFQDINNDGKYTREDYSINGNVAPKYYGGFGTNVTYKSWTLDVFADFRKQIGRNYLWSLFTVPPGGMLNLPTYYSDRWQKPGNQITHQRLTTSAGTAAGIAFQRFQTSDGIYGDASFIRIKNISVGWEIPEGMFKKMKPGMLKLYIHAQNLFTISQYKGTDPETQNLIALPPMKTVAAGIQLIF